MKQDAKVIPPAIVVLPTPAVAEKMPATFPKSSALLKTASTTTMAAARQRRLKFHLVNQEIAAKPSVILSRLNKKSAYALYIISIYVLA